MAGFELSHDEYEIPTTGEIFSGNMRGILSKLMPSYSKAVFKAYFYLRLFYVYKTISLKTLLLCLRVGNYECIAYAQSLLNCSSG